MYPFLIQFSTLVNLTRLLPMGLPPKLYRVLDFPFTDSGIAML